MALTTFRLKDGALLGAMTERKNGLPDDAGEDWPRAVKDDVAEEAAPAAGVLESDIDEVVLGTRGESRTRRPSTIK